MKNLIVNTSIEGKAILNTETLSKGVYFLTITSETEVKTIRIMRK